MRQCPRCEVAKPEHEFQWTTDRYGNPWRKVCAGCWDAQQDENSGWKFDPADAGERLEEDD